MDLDDVGCQRTRKRRRVGLPRRGQRRHDLKGCSRRNAGSEARPWRGVANAARVSRGSPVRRVVRAHGARARAPPLGARRRSPSCCTTRSRAACSTEEDVHAAVDDLEQLYASCAADGCLGDPTFDFMKEEPREGRRRHHHESEDAAVRAAAGGGDGRSTFPVDGRVTTAPCAGIHGAGPGGPLSPGPVSVFFALLRPAGWPWGGFGARRVLFSESRHQQGTHTGVKNRGIPSENDDAVWMSPKATSCIAPRRASAHGEKIRGTGANDLGPGGRARVEIDRHGACDDRLRRPRRRGAP